jgi:ribosome-binding factor A
MTEQTPFARKPLISHHATPDKKINKENIYKEMGEIRIKKVESLLNEKISEILIKNELKDPRLDKFITISKLIISKDLKIAKVYVSYIGEEEDHTTIVEVLNNAAGYIQGLLGRRIRLKHTPKLIFYKDDSIEKGFEITQKIKDLFP